MKFKIDPILKTAQDLLEVYKDEDKYDIQAQCLKISKTLQQKLKEKGINSKVIMGTFDIDEPNEEFYSDWDNDDFNSVEEMEEAKLHALHYWVEIDGKILDITASQFQNEVIDEEIPMIVYDNYEENPRYHKEKTLK
jgi:hypothetical protein